MKHQVQQQQPDGSWAPAILHATHLCERESTDGALALMRQLAKAAPDQLLRVEGIETAEPFPNQRSAVNLPGAPRGFVPPAASRKLQQCYVMHKLNDPDPARWQENLRSAALWVAWLAEHFYIAPIANWIVLASVWPETMRERGLEIDFAQIAGADIALAVGPVLSSGMRLEGAHATEHNVPVCDMTMQRSGPPGEMPSVPAFLTLAKQRGYDFSMLVRP